MTNNTSILLVAAIAFGLGFIIFVPPSTTATPNAATPTALAASEQKPSAQPKSAKADKQTGKQADKPFGDGVPVSPLTLESNAPPHHNYPPSPITSGPITVGRTTQYVVLNETMVLGAFMKLWFNDVCHPLPSQAVNLSEQILNLQSPEVRIETGAQMLTLYENLGEEGLCRLIAK